MKLFSARRFSYNFIKSPDSHIRQHAHSLLPYLYLYPFNNDNIGYVVHDEGTNSLLAFDVGEFEKSHKIISEIEQRKNAKLRYIFSTHKHNDHVGGNFRWKTERPDVTFKGYQKEFSQIPGLNERDAMHDL